MHITSQHQLTDIFTKPLGRVPFYTSEVDMWRSVSFWTEKLTEVLIRSFSKTEVSSVMQIETQGLKNKVSKTQGLKRCLTFFFFLITSLLLTLWII
jgi:hypothetical protein